MKSSKLTKQIIEKALSLGASVSGIADIEHLKTSPSHRIYSKIGLHLHDIYSDTKGQNVSTDVVWPEDAVSVVVIGIEHSADELELDWWDGTGTPGNRQLLQVNAQLAQWITNTCSITTYKLPYYVENGGIFLKDAAVHAGLGCIGQNNLLITPEYGPRIRLRALLINREAAPTGPTDFFPCDACEQFCRKACPIGAFHKGVYSPQELCQRILPGIDGTYDRVRCNSKMEKDIDDAAKILSTDDKSQQEMRQLIDQFEKSHLKQPDDDKPVDYCVKYCRKCELSCPVGER